MQPVTTKPDFYDLLEADIQAEMPTAEEIIQIELAEQREREEQRRREKERRRYQRLAQCGEFYGRYFNPENGRTKHRRYKCDLWRDQECPKCFKRRVKDLLSRVHSAAREHKRLQLRRGSKAAISEIVRGVDKSHYVRFPVVDHDVLIADFDCGGDEIEYNDVSRLDWLMLANTPRNRRMSGTLGKPEENNDETVKVPVLSFVLHSDTTKAQERQAMLAAAEATKDLQPTTPEEARAAVKKRQSAYVRALHAAGGKLLNGAARIIYVRCEIKRIHWFLYTNKMIEDDLIQSDGLH